MFWLGISLRPPKKAQNLGFAPFLYPTVTNKLSGQLNELIPKG